MRSLLLVLLFVTAAHAETFRRLPDAMPPELAALRGFWALRANHRETLVRFRHAALLEDDTPALLGRAYGREAYAYQDAGDLVVVVDRKRYCAVYRLRWHGRRLRGGFWPWTAGCGGPWLVDPFPARGRRR